jgi:hypothetical protein
MKKLFGLFLLALAFLAPAGAKAATCFWVGGTGSINDVTHWSSGTGGAGSTCAAAGSWPNSTADNGTADAASGGGTITRNVNWTIGNLNVGAFTGTFGNSGDTATVNLNTWTNTGAGVRTVNLGAATWTCGTAATTACSWFNTGTNLTFNSNTSSLVIAGSLSSANSNVQLGVFTYNVVTWNPDQSNGRGTLTSNSNGVTIGTLNIGSPNMLSFQNAHNWNITTLNFTGGSPSITSLVSFASGSFAVAFTFTLTNPATCNYCVFRDTTAITSAITATNSINLNNNTNITPFTPPTIGSGGGRIIGG